MALRFDQMTNGERPSRLLLCEGPDDAEFFRALIEIRKLPAYRVRHNGTKADPRGGNTKFVSGLRAHYELEGPFSKVLIVSDNDEKPADSFALVQKQIQKYFNFAPAQPRQVSNGPPKVSILMVPWDGESGNLETLCVASARDKDKTCGSFVDQFAAQVGVPKWKAECRKQEMWLRASLAARCDWDPFVSLRNVFSDKGNRDLIPLDHSSFKKIHDALANFAA